MAMTDTTARRLALASNLFQNLGANRRGGNGVSSVDVLMGLEKKFAERDAVTAEQKRKAEMTKLWQDRLARGAVANQPGAIAPTPLPGQGKGMFPVPSQNTPTTAPAQDPYVSKVAEYALMTDDFKGAEKMLLETQKPMTAGEQATDIDRDRAFEYGVNKDIKDFDFNKERYENDFDYKQLVDGFEQKIATLKSNREQTELEMKQAKAQTEKEAALLAKEEHKNTVSTAATTVVQDVGRALEQLDKYGNLASGWGNWATSWLPTTPARNLSDLISSVQGNIGVDQLIKIKREGSGLGQVPQSQLEMLASLLGKLDGQMDDKILTYNLTRIGEVYADIVEKNGGVDPNAKPAATGGKLSDPLGIR